MTKVLCQFAICGSLFLTVPSGALGAGCKRVLSVGDVMKNAPTLNGQIVCVMGMLVPAPVPQWNSAVIHELVPLSTEKPEKSSSNNKLGLVDWSSETGVDERYYEPDSFALLSAGEGSVQAAITHPLDVTMRVAVVYKKNLRAKVPPVIPQAREAELVREARYDVELVVLEILTVKRAEGQNNNRAPR
jgi:hypothetical protein